LGFSVAAAANNGNIIETKLSGWCFCININHMESNEEQQLDADNKLIISAEQDSTKAEKPINEEVNKGYNSADDTGNSNEDLELDPNDDPETDVDEDDLEALNGLDIDEEETI
jgi:hypothetical protein